MDAYFAFVPFHVFNCVNLKISEFPDRKGILYIMNMEGAPQTLFYQKVKDAGIFEEVHFLTMPSWDTMGNGQELMTALSGPLLSKFRARAYQIRSNFFPSLKPYAQYPFGNMVFERIFVDGTGKDHLTEFYVYQASKGCEIYRYESWSNTRIIAHSYMGLKGLFRALGYRTELDLITAHYAYMTEGYAEKNIPIRKQTSPADFSPAQKKIFESIWKNEEMVLPTKALYVSSIVRPDWDDSYWRCADYAAKEHRIIEMVSRYLHGTEFMVKKHPRNYTWEEITAPVMRVNYPLEAALYFCDVNNMMIFATHSNTFFTPKFIYDYEPRIVVLYYVMELDQPLSYIGYASMEDKINDMITKYYRDRSRVMIPKTEEELKNILKSFIHAN